MTRPTIPLAATVFQVEASERRPMFKGMSAEKNFVETIAAENVALREAGFWLLVVGAGARFLAWLCPPVAAAVHTVDAAHVAHDLVRAVSWAAKEQAQRPLGIRANYRMMV